jgi:hypothetical protein
MNATELLDELRRLPLRERLSVLEVTLHEIREELDPSFSAKSKRIATDDRNRRLREAALVALPLYEAGDELTVFTDLDGEPFLDHESR